MSEQQPQVYRSSGDSALRGCLIGCLVFFVGTLILVAILGFAAYSFVGGVMNQFTSETPRELPVVALPQEQKDLLFGKVDTFGQALNNNDLTLQPLELTGDEINTLLREYPDGQNGVDWITVQIIDGIIRADVSVPLAEMGLGNRFLNGSGEIKLEFQDGKLQLFMNSIEVDGQSLPAQFLSALQQQNLAQQMTADPKTQAILDKIQSVQVLEDRILITPAP